MTPRLVACLVAMLATLVLATSTEAAADFDENDLFDVLRVWSTGSVHSSTQFSSPYAASDKNVDFKLQDQKGRMYHQIFKRSGEQLTREECKLRGLWYKDNKEGGSCWRQDITDEILKRDDYCPLYLEQTRKECIAKGCEWRPKEIWRCFKTPELMDKESVKDIVYHGSDGETRFTPFKYEGITKEECEEGHGVWIPLPDWQCWLEIYL